MENITTDFAKYSSMQLIIILDEMKNHDLLILGASNEGILSQMLFGRLSERIASHCEKTVILVKRDMGIQSFIKRWLGRR